MTSVLACIIVALWIPLAMAGGSSRPQECVGKRVSDEKAILIAKAELSRRVSAFDESKHTWRVSDEGCQVRVEIENRNESAVGRKSTLILARTGEVKRYIGGM